jgi:membrane protease YdiL (CAAX protease family)
MFKNRILAYTVLVLGISYLYSLIYIIFPYRSTIGTLLTVLYMYLPFLTTIILKKAVYKEPFKEIGIGFKFSGWYIAAWLIPVIYSFLSLGCGLLFPGTSFAPDLSGIERFQNIMTKEKMDLIRSQMQGLPMNYIFIAIPQALIAGPTINALAAFGEETGWRGFLFNELKDKGFYKASLYTGFLWGIWHAPLILQGHNYYQHHRIGVLLMVLWCMLISPMFHYIRQKTGSVIATSIMHGTLNASGGFALLYIKGGDDLIVGMTGAAGFIALIILNILLFLHNKLTEKTKIIN